MKKFIETYIQKYDSNMISVAYSEETYPITAIQTTFGINPFQQDTDKEGHLIFIDLCVIANWSHPCTYIFYVNEAEYYVACAGWMPHSEITLTPYKISK